jgi:hypothetical protein
VQLSLFEHVQNLAGRLLGAAMGGRAPKPAMRPAPGRAPSKFERARAEWRRLRRAVPEADAMAQLEGTPFEALVREQLVTHAIKVKRWRAGMSGVAWQVRYVRGPRTGEQERWLESPLPKTELSLSIFLHEVGHHAIGFGRFKPRCLEEFKAWEWSLAEMRRCGVEVTPVVTRRVQLSLWYAVRKAKRRGLRKVPAELREYELAPVHVSQRRVVPHVAGADLWT